VGVAKDLQIPGIGPATLIARGGSAEVFKAEQIGLGRPVAIKVLFQQSTDEVAWERFERECRALGALSSHPNIVDVYGRGETGDGTPCLVMQYLSGGSLADRLALRGRLTGREVLSIGLKMAEALAAAHRAGVLHRDVKPANILLSADGEPALADFGIARLEDRATTGSMFSASIRHAPREVLTGQRPTATSDVYSLGSTLFELATGRAAYVEADDESLWALINRVLHLDRPDPRQQGVDEDLSSIIDRATDHVPDRRYPTMTDLASDLESALGLGPAWSVRSPARATAETLPLPAIDPAAAIDPATAVELPLIGASAADGSLPIGTSALPSIDTPAPAAVDRAGRSIPVSASAAAIGAMLAVTAVLGLVGYRSVASAPAIVETATAAAGGGSGEEAGDGDGAAASTVTSTTTSTTSTTSAYESSAGSTASTTAASPIADIAPPVVAFERSQVGPLTDGSTYGLAVTGLSTGDPWRLLHDGRPVTDWATGPVRYQAESGRHSLQLQVKAGDRLIRSNPIEVYVADAGPEPGFRANLSAIRSEPDNWPEALRQFDQMVLDGHRALELSLSTKRFDSGPEAGLPPHWNFYVDGFGDDRSAAQAYCDRFGLDNRSCFVASVGVDD
jgi:tRNA A-37 threonylcarbamoyl transferase component Bud32